MAKEQDYPVGYKKPPHHTRFKPGQSGNPHGRPKKPLTTIAESFERELNTHIILKEGGTQRRITKLEAIAKQQTNKAAQGDSKATMLIMRAIEPREMDRTDNLSPVLDEMRAIHRRHENEQPVGNGTLEDSTGNGNRAGNQNQARDDHA